MLLHYLTKLYLHLTLATMEDVHTLKVAAYNWQYRHRSKDNYQRYWCWQNSFLHNGILFHSTEGFSQLLFLLESERNTACFWFPNALVNFLSFLGDVFFVQVKKRKLSKMSWKPLINQKMSSYFNNRHLGNVTRISASTLWLINLYDMLLEKVNDIHMLIFCPRVIF